MFILLKRKIKSLLTPGYKKVIKQLAENQNELLNAQRDILDKISVLSTITTLKHNSEFLQKSIDNVYQQNISLDKCINTVFNYTSTIRDNVDYYQSINTVELEKAMFSNPEYLSSLFTDLSNKKILIAGFYGAYNLGDELMLQTLLSYIPKDMLKSVTVLLYRNQMYDQLNLPPVNFLHYPCTFFDYDFLAKRFDVLIWGGGAIIDDTYYTSRRTNLLGNMLIDLSDRFIKFDKKIAAIGLSASRQLTNIQYIEKLKFIAEKADYFSVRDKLSAELLKNYGIKNITEIPDIVFASKYWETHKQFIQKKDVDCVGISIVCQNETTEILNKLLDMINAEFGNECTIKLIPFFHLNENDVVFYKKFKDNLNNPKQVVICEYNNSIEEVCKEVDSTDIMINMRYHAMLISQMLGKPSLNIMYELSPHYYNKVTHIINEFGTIENMVTLSDFTNKEFKELKSLKRPIDRYDLYEKASRKIEEILNKYVR